MRVGGGGGRGCEGWGFAVGFVHDRANFERILEGYPLDGRETVGGGVLRLVGFGVQVVRCA